MNTTTRTGRAWGATIKERRQMVGLSQQALADAIGVSQAAVTHWERGIRLPSRRSLALICRQLGLPAAAFTFDAEDVA